MIKVESSSGRWGRLVERIVSFLDQDTVSLRVSGRDVIGYRSPDNPALWIRDHSDIMRAGRYHLPDVKSAIDCFADAQAAGGRIFDFVTTRPVGARENWEEWVRIPVEADVEYRLVKAAYLAWQASGDDAWIASILPSLETALNYTRTHPDRWHEPLGLVKRPYTIDTWDFDYTAGKAPWLNFQITDDTFWGHLSRRQLRCIRSSRSFSPACTGPQVDQVAHPTGCSSPMDSERGPMSCFLMVGSTPPSTRSHPLRSTAWMSLSS